jgi:CBS domain-containing protein
MASNDPVAYLRATPPFDALPAALFERAARALEVAYWGAGTRLARAGGEPLQHLYVIRKGAVRLEHDGQSIQLLEEGESFGLTSLMLGQATVDIEVEQDLLAYLLPRAEFERLLSDAPFARHFAMELSERFRASVAHDTAASTQADISQPVSGLVKRAPLWVEEAATVGEAARVMREHRASSVLVRGEPPGIVTDRDLRNRVLADGRGPDTPVAEVRTRPLFTVAAESPVYEAWDRLLSTGVHHLPVVRDEAIVGVVTSTDVLRATAQGPVAVLRGVERLDSREGLRGYGSRVSDMAAALLAGGLEAGHVAGFVARLNDALVQRILQMAEADLGPPPAPYAWMVFGSEGRMEQTLLTDQDNALVFADGAGDRGWFDRLAERANEDLLTAGFPRCPGGYMAVNWKGPLPEWEHRFRVWVEATTPRSLLEAAIFFDFRRVAGELSLDSLDDIVADAPRQPLFLRMLAKDALAFKPPATLMLRLRGSSSQVDLKKEAISPIVFLARCYALQAGTRARGTIERLEVAGRKRVMGGEEVWSDLADAYRFLLSMRLRVQLAQIDRGEKASNLVAWSELTALDRSRLREVFRVVKSWQDLAVHHFHLNF